LGDAIVEVSPVPPPSSLHNGFAVIAGGARFGARLDG
jgi:hypothetical protein